MEMETEKISPEDEAVAREIVFEELGPAGTNTGLNTIGARFRDRITTALRTKGEAEYQRGRDDQRREDAELLDAYTKSARAVHDYHDPVFGPYEECEHTYCKRAADILARLGQGERER